METITITEIDGVVNEPEEGFRFPTIVFESAAQAGEYLYESGWLEEMGLRRA